jgi:transcriptional antiterminator NusG
MNNDRRWYIIQTYSGFENSVKEALERRIETMGQQDYIFNVLIPEEEYEDVKKDGTKVIKTRKMFPSYVFVEMIVTEKSWFIVRNTPKVTGFLGSSGKGAKPVPLPPDEINGILRTIGLMSKPVYDFNVGDKVLVISGPFTDKIAEISAVNEEKEIVTVLIEFFGRPSPTELTFNEVKKLENE